LRRFLEENGRKDANAAEKDPAAKKAWLNAYGTSMRSTGKIIGKVARVFGYLVSVAWREFGASSI
jgi:hypothetical protein